MARWRRSDLARKTERQFGIVLAERSVGERLTRLGFRRLSARPQQLDTDAPWRRIKNVADLVADALPAMATGKQLELWWQDEARVGQ